MAKKLDEFPRMNGRGHHSGTYPWNDWLDGNVWELETGKDFKVKLESFRNQAFRVGMMRGLKIRTVTKGKNLVIQAYKKEDE